jgi:flagellar motor switch protein FliN/FliY
MPVAIRSVDPQKTAEILASASPLEWTDFGALDGEAGQDDVASEEVEIRVELGRTAISASDVEGLDCGSVVRLDQPVEHPVRIYADDRLVAEGELLVLDDRYALRITETFAG